MKLANLLNVDVRTLARLLARQGVGVPKFKMYRSLVSQTGSATPVANEIINTVGTATLSRVEIGVYTITFPTGTIPDPAKVFVSGFGSGPRMKQLFGDGANHKILKVCCVLPDTIHILTTDAAGAAEEMSSSFDGEDYSAIAVDFEVYP